MVKTGQFTTNVKATESLWSTNSPRLLSTPLPATVRRHVAVDGSVLYWNGHLFRDTVTFTASMILA